MATDTLIYLSCTIVGLVLALQVTQYWWRQKKDETIVYWMMSAWVLTGADLVFAIQPALPRDLGRVLPTVLVSVGHGVLLLGAQHTGGLRPRFRILAAIIALQIFGLIGFQYLAHPGNWRMVFNGVFWSAFCFASYACIRRGSKYYWDSPNSPAVVFLCQGVYHILRMAAAMLFEAQQWTQATAVLHFVSNIEVLLFAGSLFIALLLAQLQIRQDELKTTRTELLRVTGLLPLCAWCKKVRDDDGYWKEIAEYLDRHSLVHVTDGICTSCAEGLAKANTALSASYRAQIPVAIRVPPKVPAAPSEPSAPSSGPKAP